MFNKKINDKKSRDNKSISSKKAFVLMSLRLYVEIIC